MYSAKKINMKYAKSSAQRDSLSYFCPRCTAKSGGSQANECALPNPKGKEVQDSSRAKDRLLSCKQYANVAIMNVRTLRLESKRNELVNNRKTYATPILDIVDHKIVHDDKMLYQHVENKTGITSSAWRNANKASSGGAGLIINRRA